MTRFRINQRRIILGLVALAVVSSLLRSTAASRISSAPRHALETIEAPFTQGARSVLSAIRPPQPSVERRTDTPTLQQNYDQLLQYTRQLEDELVRARQQITQLSQIPPEMRVRTQFVSAAVTDWGGRGNPVLTLNRGTRAGLRVGLVAADGFSVVGKISDVGPFSATVRLITAPGAKLAVRILPPKAGGPLRPLTQVQVAEDGRTFFARLGKDEGCQIGDLVFLADDSWPRESNGYVVGQVTDVGDDPDYPTLRRLATVTPIPNLARLSRVAVLVPPEADPNLLH